MLKIILLCAMFMFSSLSFAMGNPFAAKSEISFGETAPDFTLPMTSGIAKSLAQARAKKKTVLFFWTTWCPHCHEELVLMNSKLKALSQKGINVVLVNLGENWAQAKEYLLYNKISLESFVDEDNTLQDLYRINGVPTVFFLNEAGTIINVTHAFPPDAEKYFTARR